MYLAAAAQAMQDTVWDVVARPLGKSRPGESLTLEQTVESGL